MMLRVLHGGTEVLRGRRLKGPEGERQRSQRGEIEHRALRRCTAGVEDK